MNIFISSSLTYLGTVQNSKKDHDYLVSNQHMTYKAKLWDPVEVFCLSELRGTSIKRVKVM